MHIPLNYSMRKTREEYYPCQTNVHTNKPLFISRSADGFDRIFRKRSYPYVSTNVDPVYQSSIRRRNHSDTTLMKTDQYQLENVRESSNNSEQNRPAKLSIPTELQLQQQKALYQRNSSVQWDENALKSTLKQYQAAIIEIKPQSYASSLSTSMHSRRIVEKSYSAPLPINTNHPSMNNNHIQSAHIMDQYQFETKSAMSLDSYDNQSENNELMTSDSSEEEGVTHTLLQYEKTINAKRLRHRWSLLDIWQKTLGRLPPILNCIWRQSLRLTGSREFLLEYDRTLPINHTNNNQANFIQEQRYVEQERPIHSHFGLALLALLIFPPVGILAMILSVWSLCGEQDRHLSRKFGNAVYWISLLSICLSFLLLVTLFTYFTYQYLITRSRLCSNSHPITSQLEKKLF